MKLENWKSEKNWNFGLQVKIEKKAGFYIYWFQYEFRRKEEIFREE